MSSSGGMVKYSMDDAFEHIYEATVKFLTPLDLKDTYKKITEEGKNLIDAKFATIFLAKKNKLVHMYTSGTAFYRLNLRKNGYTYTAFTTGKPTYIPIEKYIKTHPEAITGSIKTIFHVPLTNGGKTVGVLNLHSENKYLDVNSTLKSLQLFGSLASLAIRKAQLYKEIKDSLDAQNLFISVAAHELRTPLTTINGYAQLFNQKLARNEMPKKSWAETMQFETLRLRRLMNELLQMDQIKKGGFHYKFEYLSVTDVLKQALKDVKFKYPKHSYVVNQQYEDHDIVKGDYDKLLQVFINILNNASKFTPSEKPINMYIKKSASYIVAIVSDQGKGISQKDKKHIFEEFFKGENSKTEGLGMGLFISKKIIDDHAGKIRIKSKLNEGTRVEIKLPRPKM